MKLVKIRSSLYPICSIDKSYLLCYKYGRFYKYNPQDNTTELIISIDLGYLRNILSRFSFTRRRYGLFSVKGCKIDDNRALILAFKRFYIINILDKSLTCVDFPCENKVLHFTPTSKGPIWGDYGYNPQKRSKSVYRYNSDNNKLECLHTFKDGEINHIHRIIEDEEIDRLYVLTGDFGSSAAIYYTDDDFSSFNLLRSNNQNYRSCCGITSRRSLVYATDTPMQLNHLYIIEQGTEKKITELNGSCIYSCVKDKRLYGSTTVENQPDEFNNGKNKYKYNLGKGIKDWYVELFCYEPLTNKYILIDRRKKDFLPMLAFGYGCYHFPCLSKDYKGPVVCYGYGVMKYDQCLLKIED